MTLQQYKAPFSFGKLLQMDMGVSETSWRRSRRTVLELEAAIHIVFGAFCQGMLGL